MANVVGLLNRRICCEKFALVLFGCKRVLGLKSPFWQFSRNDSAMILTSSGLLLLTAVRNFDYIYLYIYICIIEIQLTYRELS